MQKLANVSWNLQVMEFFNDWFEWFKLIGFFLGKGEGRGSGTNILCFLFCTFYLIAGKLITYMLQSFN